MNSISSNLEISRGNITNVFKLIVKELIESRISSGRTIDTESELLNQFFVVLEAIFFHGLKEKKSLGLIKEEKEFWSMLKHAEKSIPEIEQVNQSVRDIPCVTLTGKGRAWLRLCVMQKCLADIMRELLELRSSVLSLFYEDQAIVMQESGVVVAGILVGLNVIDFNLDIKAHSAELDKPGKSINFGRYLQFSGPMNFPPDEIEAECKYDAETNQTDNGKMARILDQKNYVEELNIRLQRTIKTLEEKCAELEQSQTELKTDLASTKNRLLQIEEENNFLIKEKSNLLDECNRKIQVMDNDIKTERDTYAASRTGLDQLYSEAKIRLAEEVKKRDAAEKEIQLQTVIRTELEAANKVLTKENLEQNEGKQSMIKQLEEVKKMNSELNNKLQSVQGSLGHKTDLVQRLEEKTSEMKSIIREYESRLKQAESDKEAAEETQASLGRQLSEIESKRVQVLAELKVTKDELERMKQSLIDEKTDKKQLQSQLSCLKTEMDALRRQHNRLKQDFEEQELALAELGSHLGQSKEAALEAKKTHEMIAGAQWKDDTTVTECKNCQKEFSLARRKHHCRNCGDIFCNECSDNKFLLPSSSKPVRVCDSCNTFLMKRYSAK